MADHGEVEYATADGNDYAEHEGTYHMFLTLTKWIVGFLIILLIAMAYFLVSSCCHYRGPRGGVMKSSGPTEAAPESRVAATSDTVKKMKALGADVVVQAGAG